jgi:glycosyltransferase involved in cell wall biosynthesis
MGRPPIAIVHDYLTQRGGAEQVVLSMLRMFPDAPVYTALYEPASTYPEFSQYDIRTLATNRIGVMRRHHRCGLLVYPFAFAAAHVDADVVLCSSSGFAHGVRTTGHKIVYCYTPPRWLYEEASSYLATWPTGVAALLRVVAPGLRRWDKRAAASADVYLTSSQAVRERIKRAYGIDPRVIPPAVRPLAGRTNRSMPGILPGFVLCVSRLLSYKNVEAVMAAFEHLPNSRLFIVGTGPERSRLTAMAGSNVTLLGRVGDEELGWLYSNCAGVVAASHEDFGLTPLEAASFGKPVAVLRSGGFLDTVVEGDTGIFFDEPDSLSIAEAVSGLLAQPWDNTAIHLHADSFLEDRFAECIRRAITDLKNGETNVPLAQSERCVNGSARGVQIG